MNSAVPLAGHGQAGIGYVQESDALLFIWVGSSDQSDAWHGVARVIGQMRNVGWNVGEIAGTHPHMLLEAVAVPHASLAGDYVDGAFVVLVEMGFGASAGRNGDQVQAERMCARRFGGNTLEIFEALFPTVGARSPDQQAS